MEILLTLKSDKSLLQDKNIEASNDTTQFADINWKKERKIRQTHQMKIITDRLRDLILPFCK